MRLWFLPALLVAGSWLTALSDGPWTYWVLGVTAIVTEELGPIFGGIAAHEGQLHVGRVIFAITVGGWAATILLYALGRLKWDAIRRRFPKARSTGTVALRVVRNNPLKASFFVRFAFGLRIVLPMACGAAGVPLYIYLPVSLLGSVVWTSFFTAVGYAAGEAAVQAMGHIGQAGELVGAVLLTVAILAFVRWQRKRRERKAARADSRREPTPLPSDHALTHDDIDIGSTR
ncbi:MAG TPA: VTT domain-containing protein [Gemmatimonas sp.]|uniref:DedA family protein n=1 Tax=Gemmatimonas sp. TaxID=1962908 RepID=UPI002EDB87EF